MRSRASQKLTEKRTCMTMKSTVMWRNEQDTTKNCVALYREIECTLYMCVCVCVCVCVCACVCVCVCVCV